MTEDSQQRLVDEKTRSTAEQIASHLRIHPQDLIDIRCLMRRFHASAQDFSRALLLLEQPLQS